MIKIGNKFLETESLIEFLIKPNTNINKTLIEIASLNEHNYIIDYSLNMKLLGIDTVFPSSCRQLFAFLEKIKLKSKFFLFIDSIPHFIDLLREEGVNELVLYNKLWDVIYTCKATVVAVNHFKKVGYYPYYGFIPRLGDKWYKMVDYRITVKELDGKTIFNVKMNDLIDFND